MRTIKALREEVVRLRNLFEACQDQRAADAAYIAQLQKEIIKWSNRRSFG